MAKRWGIYDHDEDAMATTMVYPSYEEASSDARELENVIVIPLGDIARDESPAEEDEEEIDEDDIVEDQT